MARVLVVDDDAAIRQMLRCALDLEGHEATEAPNGAQVVSLLSEASEQWIVLLDLMMPYVTGWDVLRALAERPDLTARHVVIVMSADISPDDVFPDIVRAALLKPFNLMMVISLVERFAATPLCAPPASHDTARV